jgi:hypothetical protein
MMKSQPKQRKLQGRLLRSNKHIHSWSIQKISALIDDNEPSRIISHRLGFSGLFLLGCSLTQMPSSG